MLKFAQKELSIAGVNEVSTIKVLALINLAQNQGHTGFSIGFLKGILARYVQDGYTKVREELEKTVEECKTDLDAFEMQRLITDNALSIMDLAEAIKATKHDLNDFLKLMMFTPLTPLYGDDSEWNDISEFMCKPGVKSYQNNRCSSVFMEVSSDGTTSTYYTSGRIFSDNGGVNWFTTNDCAGLSSNVSIESFPWSVPENPEEVFVKAIKTEEGDYDYEIVTDSEEIKAIAEKYRELFDEESNSYTLNEVFSSIKPGVSFSMRSIRDFDVVIEMNKAEEIIINFYEKGSKDRQEVPISVYGVIMDKNTRFKKCDTADNLSSTETDSCECCECCCCEG